MNGAKLAARLTHAGLRYETMNLHGSIVFTTTPKFDFYPSVAFYSAGNHTTAQCGGKMISVSEGIRIAHATCKLVEGESALPKEIRDTWQG